MGLAVGPARLYRLRCSTQAAMEVGPLGRLGREGGARGAQLVQSTAEAHERSGQVVAAISAAVSASWSGLGLGLGLGLELVGLGLELVGSGLGSELGSGLG